GSGTGFAFRCAGVIALVAFVLLSFLGTVPINIRVNDWQADSPPADWKAVVKRWELIDVFRSSAAILAFACFLIALALQLTSSGI
ncbi:MAG: anthrone oxygenase family protein, partial [Microbacteriaceae bacterium]